MRRRERSFQLSAELNARKYPMWKRVGNMFEDKDESEQINNTYVKMIRLLLEERVVYLGLNQTADATRKEVRI